MLKLHRSGFYAWLKHPKAPRTVENEALTECIKAIYAESGGVYGSPRIHAQLVSQGQRVSVDRVARLMAKANIKAQLGYKRPQFRTGTASIVAQNYVQQDFKVGLPNQIWVTDITYIKTREGWLYLAIVLDLFSRKVIGWSMQPEMKTDLVIRALLMALWRRRPKQDVYVHSDQGSQYTSEAFQTFLTAHGLIGSMSRRGQCLDNAVAESFFGSLKTERVKRKIYATRDEARSDLFDYIEMFYNRQRLHSQLDYMSPEQFEKPYV